MATTTENLGLTLPAGTDRALVSVLNENFQAIDTFAGQATADIQEAQETANAAAPQATTYTKDEVDTALAAKADSSDVYDKDAVDDLLEGKVDVETGKGLSTNDFTNADKANLTTALTKANAASPQSTTYTKTEVDTALAAKLNTADVDADLSSTSTNPVQNKVVQASVARLVDAGAKNLYIITNSSGQYLGVTFTVNDNGTVSVTGTATTSNSVFRPGNWTCPKSGTYIVSGCPAGGSWAPNTNKYRIRIAVNGIWKGDDVGSGISLSLSAGDVVELQINTSAGYEVSNLIFKPMICTAEDHAISPEFVPHTPTMRELYEMILALQNA